MVAKSGPVRPARKWALLLAVLLAAAWCLIALFLGPRLIESAYRGESYGFLNEVLGGRETHPLSRYMAVWWAFVGRATIALVVVAGVALAVASRWSAIRSRLGGIFGGRTLGATAILSSAAAVGLASGLLEFVVWKIRVRIDGFSVQWSNVDTIWLAPLLMTGFAVTAAVPFAIVARRTGRGINAGVVLAFVAAICFFALIRSTRIGIHPVAAIVLAIGLAAATQRGLVRRGVPFSPRLTARTAASLAGVCLIGVLMLGGRAIRERLLIAGLPPAAAGMPNVVVIILDTVRAESMSLYGYPRPTTPEMTRIGQRGLVFDDAIVPAPWTLPTHASMFTGLLPSEHGANWRVALDGRPPTLAEFLRERGYATGGFVANLEYTTRATGIDRGFIRYDDYALDLRSVLGSAWYGGKVRQVLSSITGDSRFWRKNAPEVNREALDWIDSVGDRPFFVFMNFYDAHGPYEMHAEFAHVLDGVVVDSVPDESARWVKRDERLVVDRDRYDTSLAFLDSRIGMFHDELDRRGLLDNTLLIITSDHGEMFGEHGLVGHAKGLYDPVLRVPLIVAGPDLEQAPRRVSETARLTDLPATVAAWIAGPAAVPFPGESFLDLPDDVETAMRPRFAISQVTPNPWVQPDGPLELGPAISVSWNGKRLIRWGDGSQEFFDVRADPAEIRDLSDEAALQDLIRLMSLRIDSVSRKAGMAAPVDGARAARVASPERSAGGR